jgi:hypothetical protein
MLRDIKGNEESAAFLVASRVVGFSVEILEPINPASSSS